MGRDSKEGRKRAISITIYRKKGNEGRKTKEGRGEKWKTPERGIEKRALQG